MFNQKKQVNGNNKAANQGSAAGEKPVKGIENYSRNEIKEIARDHISQVLEDSEIDVTIKGMEIHGSRSRGDLREDSDLDIVVEYITRFTTLRAYSKKSVVD
jgi:predicted nucleotidyltransferase